MWLAFNIPYVYDLITLLCRQQAAVILKDANANTCDVEYREVARRKYE